MCIRKLVAVLLSVVLINCSIPPKAVEASWFSDFFGGIFTIITAPIWVFCPDNPTFRKNNPFRKKVWQEEEEEFRRKHEEENKSLRIPFHQPQRENRIGYVPDFSIENNHIEPPKTSSSHKNGQKPTEPTENEKDDEFSDNETSEKETLPEPLSWGDSVCYIPFKDIESYNAYKLESNEEATSTETEQQETASTEPHIDEPTPIPTAEPTPEPVPTAIDTSEQSSENSENNEKHKEEATSTETKKSYSLWSYAILGSIGTVIFVSVLKILNRIKPPETVEPADDPHTDGGNDDRPDGDMGRRTLWDRIMGLGRGLLELEMEFIELEMEFIGELWWA